MSGSLAVATGGGRTNDWPVAVRDLNASTAHTAYSRDPDAQHSRLVKWFEESEQACSDARERSRRDRDYVNGIQWTREEEEILRARGQPVISVNYCRRKLSLLCGLERKARTDPKAFPRTPVEEERADAATQALRYIADDNDYSIIRSDIFDEMLVEGFGGLEMSLEDDGQGGADIRLTQVAWDRLWYDPHCRRTDFLDARYKGIVIWMDDDEAYEMWPDAQGVIEAAFSTSGTMAEFRDRPDQLMWTDNRRTRVRIATCHWKEAGEWWYATYTRAGYLAQPRRSMFKDKRGRSACSLLLQSGYIDQDNNRFGIIRDLVPLQDEINKRHSKALHLVSVHQVIAEQGAVQDVDKARREVAKPDGFIEHMPGMKFEINEGTDLAVAQFQLLQHATAEMQLSGPNAAMSGTDPRELSGRAILAQQAGGAVQNEPLADSLRMFSRRVYEMAWMAAREYWGPGKWVRVTDELQDTRWVGINRPVTLQDELADLEPEEIAQVAAQMQLVPDDPRLQQVVRIENDISDLDVDISIAEGQDTPTLQAETFQTLVQLAGLQPGLIPPEVLIAASSLKDKDDILKRLKDMQEQRTQQQQVASQKAMEAADADTFGKMARGQADLALARERGASTAGKIHEVHAQFAAAPYGQPFAAEPGSPGPAAPPPDPEAMTPEIAQAHHLADLERKRVDTAVAAAGLGKSQADVAKVIADTGKARADTAKSLTETNRLMRTPIENPNARPKGGK